jgi:hypothetical protein
VEAGLCCLLKPVEYQRALPIYFALFRKKSRRALLAHFGLFGQKSRRALLGYFEIAPGNWLLSFCEYRFPSGSAGLTSPVLSNFQLIVVYPYSNSLPSAFLLCL